jgi:hypothetical protein
MYRIALAVGFLLVTSAAYAQRSTPETFTYEAITANSPIGISRLRVTKVDADAYAIDSQ